MSRIPTPPSPPKIPPTPKPYSPPPPPPPPPSPPSPPSPKEGRGEGNERGEGRAETAGGCLTMAQKVLSRGSTSDLVDFLT